MERRPQVQDTLSGILKKKSKREVRFGVEGDWKRKQY